jgi:tetratricopeptide (TPR) repeat protein
MGVRSAKYAVSAKVSVKARGREDVGTLKDNDNRKRDRDGSRRDRDRDHDHDRDDGGDHEREQERLDSWLKRGGERQFREQMTMGARLLQARMAKEALPLLKRAHEIRPDNIDAAMNLGSAYIMLGRHKQAVPVLEQAVRLEPKNPRLWINLGAAYLGNPVLANDDQQLKAIAAFQRALQIDPFAPSAAYNIGLIHVDRGERDQAIAAFRLAARSDPGDMDAKRMLKRLEEDDDSSAFA